MPGPAPKPTEQRRRRNAPIANTVKLPVEGRRGETPRWPLDEPEPGIWRELWETPQAVAWERLGWTRSVARYARLAEEAEKLGTSAAILSEVRQMEDRLGLSPMSMLRLRWEIVSDDTAERRDARWAATGDSTPRRLRIADADTAG